MVRVNRTTIPNAAEDPSIRIAVVLADRFLLPDCLLVDPLPKLLLRLERTFQIEAKAMRWLAMLANPTSVTRVGLDVVGQRHPQFDLSLTKFL